MGLWARALVVKGATVMFSCSSQAWAELPSGKLLGAAATGGDAVTLELLELHLA